MTQQAISFATRACLVAGLLAAAWTATLAQPNPYTETQNWLERPENRPMGAASSVYTDAEGNVWIAERCGQNSGVDRDDSVAAFIPNPDFDPSVSAAIGAHGIAANALGEIFGAEVGAATVRKYIRR